MKSKTLQKLKIVAKAEEKELENKLRRITASINDLSESINMWKGHLVRVDDELRRILATGAPGGQVQLLFRHKDSLKVSISRLEENISQLNKDFDNLARELSEKKNRTKYIDGELEKNIKAELRRKQDREERDITELWHKAG